jgi:WD40 repeat protein
VDFNMLGINVKNKTVLEGHRAAIYAVIAYDQPTHFLSAGGDGWIVSWDLEKPENGELLATVPGNIFSCLYLEKENWVVAGDMNGGLHWVDLETKKNFKSSQVHQKGVFDLKLIAKGLISLGGDGSICRWDIESARALESLQISKERLRSMAYAPERNELAVAASDGYIYFLEADSWQLKHKIKAHEHSVFCLKYSPDGKFLLSGGRDAFLRIWDIENNFEEQPTEAAHLFTVNALAFHPSAPILATASRDKTIKLWDLTDFRLLKVIDAIKGGHINSVNDLYWSTYKNQLISCSDDRTLRIWEFGLEG